MPSPASLAATGRSLVRWLLARDLRWREMWLLALVCGLPVLGGAIGRLLKGRPWLVDLDAVLCASERMAHGLSPYVDAPQCAGLDPVPYVYAPQLAGVLAPVLALTGVDAFKAIYTALLVVLVVWLVRSSLIGRLAAAPRLALMGFSLMTGSSIASGNLGLLLHLVILLAALELRTSLLPFLLAVVLAALVKPQMATYSLAPLLLDLPGLRRLWLAGGVMAASILGVAAEFASAGPLREAWLDLANRTSLTEQAGIGLLGWVQPLGLSIRDPAFLVLFALYAIAFLGAAIAIVERLRLAFAERVLLGVFMAILINPRPMDYDLLAIPAAMSVLLVRTKGLGPRAQLLAVGAYTGVCAAVFCLHELDVNWMRPTELSIGLLVALFGAIGLAAVFAKPIGAPEHGESDLAA